MVTPGADPGAIRLAFEGAEAVEVSTGGDAVVRAATGKARHRKPLVYQETAAGTRQIIAGSYVLDGTGGPRFVADRHDRSRPLVIRYGPDQPGQPGLGSLLHSPYIKQTRATPASPQRPIPLDIVQHRE